MALHTELRLIIGRLEEFSLRVQDGLDQLDWATQRELIRTLVKQVEIEQQQVNVVFRVGPTSPTPDLGKDFLQHCKGRGESIISKYCAQRYRKYPQIHRYKDIKGRWVEPTIRYADDMVIILRPQDDAKEILEKVSQFLAERGMKKSEKKTKLTATTDGFDFLGWHISVQSNGKFRCVPSADNFKAFRKKVKAIVNCSNYGATEKATRLAPVVRGWRNYHRYCRMKGSRLSLWHINHRTYKVFNKETNQDKNSANKLIKQAFPSLPYSENKHINVKGDKSPTTET